MMKKQLIYHKEAKEFEFNGLFCATVPLRFLCLSICSNDKIAMYFFYKKYISYFYKMMNKIRSGQIWCAFLCFYSVFEGAVN